MGEPRSTNHTRFPQIRKCESSPRRTGKWIFPRHHAGAEHLRIFLQKRGSRRRLTRAFLVPFHYQTRSEAASHERRTATAHPTLTDREGEPEQKLAPATRGFARAGSGESRIASLRRAKLDANTTETGTGSLFLGISVIFPRHLPAPRPRRPRI